MFFPGILTQICIQDLKLYTQLSICFIHINMSGFLKFSCKTLCKKNFPHASNRKLKPTTQFKLMKEASSTDTLNLEYRAFHNLTLDTFGRNIICFKSFESFPPRNTGPYPLGYILIPCSDSASNKR